MADITSIRTERKIPGIGMADCLMFASPAATVNAAGEFARKAVRAWAEDGYWSGLGAQSTADFLASGHSREALRHFNRAQAALAQEHKLGGGQRPSVAGGAWVMPLVIQGNPLPARIKTREKLAPKNIRLLFNISGGVNAEEVARIGARIARACWDYQLAGGIVTLSVGFLGAHMRGTPNRHRYCLVESMVPLTSESAIALALSPVFFRAAIYPLCDRLNNPIDSECTLAQSVILTGLPPEFTVLSGMESRDLPKLKALGLSWEGEQA